MSLPVEGRSASRASWIARLVALWALAIIGRLIYLQVVRHEDYLRVATAQHHQTVSIRADRGELLDRGGQHPLALSIRTRSVVINPRRVIHDDFFAGLVAPVLGMDPAELAAKVREHKGRSAKASGRDFLLLKRHITADEEQRLRALPFRFLEFPADARREYPNGRLAAHVVGSLDGDGNGNAGVEQTLNKELEGRAGRMRVLTDSMQDRYISWVEDPGEQGANVTLAIDSGIQYDAERWLEWGVKEASAASGSIVVMEPVSGEVLALTNWPTFDPREEVPAEPKAREAAMERRRNIAVQAPCEPGSAMKMITIAMGLDTGRFTPETPVFCENGRFPRPGRKPITDLHPYGTLELAGVLIKSSNIGVAKVSIQVGPRTLYEYLKKFGMGEKTGIEQPGETRGMLRKLDCDGPKDDWCWSASSHEYIAFGHEIGATALQLARAVSVIANGGMLVEPRLVLRKQRPRADGSIEEIAVERPKAVRVLRPETAFQVRQIMRRVVLEGTGKRAQIAGWSTAGKTGSAEQFKEGVGWIDRHNSSFIGFAPAVNPRVVVVVTLNGTPKQGAVAAAPVWAQVAEAALRLSQVPKDEPEREARPLVAVAAASQPVERQVEAESEQPAQPPAAAERTPYLVAPRVPDFRGKSVVEVLRQATAEGVEIEIVGRGRARRQSPPAGSVLPANTRVRVEFANP